MANGGNDVPDSKLPSLPDKWVKLQNLRKRIESDGASNFKDVLLYRDLAVASPEYWPALALAMDMVQKQLVEKMGAGSGRAALLAEMDIWKERLGYDKVSPIERLVIDNLMTVWLRLVYVENCYNHIIVRESIPVESVKFWEGILASSQKRYLRALETLARIRRFAKFFPAVQVNINQVGGQQMNVSGDIKQGQS